MICIDSSVAVKWLFEEDLSGQAEALYQHTIAASERIVAPALLPIEINNTIRQRTRRARQPKEQPLDITQAKFLLELFLSFPIDLATPSGLHQQALELADVHGLPAVYDAYYVALAQGLGCPLWTADKRLINTLQSKLPFVRWIGDYRGRETV